jgi:hypothetical protein
MRIGLDPIGLPFSTDTGVPSGRNADTVLRFAANTRSSSDTANRTRNADNTSVRAYRFTPDTDRAASIAQTEHACWLRGLRSRIARRGCRESDDSIHALAENTVAARASVSFNTD